MPRKNHGGGSLSPEIDRRSGQVPEGDRRRGSVGQYGQPPLWNRQAVSSRVAVRKRLLPENPFADMKGFR